MRKQLSKLPRYIFYLLLVTILLVIVDLGVYQNTLLNKIIHTWYHVALGIGLFSIIVRHAIRQQLPKVSVVITDVALALISGYLIFRYFDRYVEGVSALRYVYIAIALLFVREFADLNINFNRRYLNPAQLFVLSFLTLVLLGTVMLVLPNATYDGISLVDALFTATSAVCVTGLIVVDTGSYFTPFGQGVIMGLIQMGGIGIMTITSYFSYFFRSGSSYEQQLMLKDMLNTSKLGEVFSVVRQIVILTFLIEAIGAAIIFFTLPSTGFDTMGDAVYFAAFHAISAFCNAGFSTMPNSLYEAGMRFNYPLQLTFSGLIILGGIGFPIFFSFMAFLRYHTIDRIKSLILRQEREHRARLIDANTRVVLITTSALLLVGTLMFMVFEYNNTLAEHSTWGKIVTSFFGATTPRTAGFNSVDMAALAPPTLILTIMLMWVGASPGSTGGGIKTTTLAVAILNVISTARANNRIEIFNRELAPESVKRAFAIITLSVLAVGLSTLLLRITEGDIPMVSLVFESLSAYSTVGLSLGITGSLSYFGKLVIIVTMFVGRVSMMSVLMAILPPAKDKRYRLPSETVFIN